MRVLSLLSHISTHEHSQRSPKASSGCSRWPYRPSAQLGQAHRTKGGPGRRCCGVASVTPRCRVDSASQFDPADAWSDDHRQQSPTRAHRRRAGALRRIELEPDARGCRQSACEPAHEGETARDERDERGSAHWERRSELQRWDAAKECAETVLSKVVGASQNGKMALSYHFSTVSIFFARLFDCLLVS